jgi:hypothetical protein
VKVDPSIPLVSPGLRKYPIIIFLMNDFFQFTRYEAKAFREYLEGGGFAIFFAIGLCDPVCGRPIAAPAIMQMFRDVFGDKFRHTLALADSLDMNRPRDEKVSRPVRIDYAGKQKIPLTDEKCQSQPVTHMEGIWRNRRLILVYSEHFDVHHYLDLNMLVYALTQTGGKTQHLVDASTVTSQKSRKFWDYRSRLQFRDEEKSLFNPKYQPKTP